MQTFKRPSLLVLPSPGGAVTENVNGRSRRTPKLLTVAFCSIKNPAKENAYVAHGRLWSAPSLPVLIDFSIQE
jgi:hypothetical protein